MESLVGCLLIALCAAVALAAPGSWPQPYAYAPAPAPARTMLWSGYFGGVQPWGRGGDTFRHFLPRSYEPQGAMTAFAAGDTVHAGSFFNGHDIASDGDGKPLECGQCADEPPAPAPPLPEVIPVNIPVNTPVSIPEEEELPAGDDPNAVVPASEEPAPVPEGDLDEPAPPLPPPPPPPPAVAPAVGNGNGKKNGNGKPTAGSGRGHKGNGNGKKKPPVEDEEDYSEEEEDDEDDLPAFLPGKRGRGRGNFYNTYFPMIFGGGGRGRSGGGGGEPGAATAIANSFSKGRGAVATSHATAYGGPHTLGGGSGQRRSKAASRRESPLTIE